MYRAFCCRAFVSRFRYYSQAARRQPFDMTVGNTAVPGIEWKKLTARGRRCNCPSVFPVPLIGYKNDLATSVPCGFGYLCFLPSK